MDNATYHRLPSISKSGLDLIARSPAHYKYAPKREQTRAMMIGSATHSAILEPESFSTQYYTAIGASDRRSKQYKEAVEIHGAEFVLLPDEFDQINAMAIAVRGDEHISPILNSPGSAEKSFFANDPITGVECRIRIDWLTDDFRTMDLKTSRDIRPEKFIRSVFDYRYHVQQAFYEDVFLWSTGEKLREWKFALVESESPHVCALVSLPDDLVAYARKIYRRDLNLYAECLAADKWPSPTPEPYVIELPSWAQYKIDDELDLTGIETEADANE